MSDSSIMENSTANEALLKRLDAFAYRSPERPLASFSTIKIEKPTALKRPSSEDTRTSQSIPKKIKRDPSAYAHLRELNDYLKPELDRKSLPDENSYLTHSCSHILRHQVTILFWKSDVITMTYESLVLARYQPN